MNKHIIKKTRSIGPSTSPAISLAMLAHLSTHTDARRAMAAEPRSSSWTPENRPRPSSAVFEIAPLLYEARRTPGLPMTRDDASEVEAYSELAFLNMVKGQGSYESWAMLTNALNVAVCLNDMDITAEDYSKELQAALDGLFAAKIRAGRTGRWGFSGPDIAAVRRGLDVHIAQLTVASRTEIHEAALLVQQRLKEGNVYQEAETQKTCAEETERVS